MGQTGLQTYFLKWQKSATNLRRATAIQVALKWSIVDSSLESSRFGRAKKNIPGQMVIHSFCTEKSVDNLYCNSVVCLSGLFWCSYIAGSLERNSRLLLAMNINIRLRPHHHHQHTLVTISCDTCDKKLSQVTISCHKCVLGGQ